MELYTSPEDKDSWFVTRPIRDVLSAFLIQYLQMWKAPLGSLLRRLPIQDQCDRGRGGCFHGLVQQEPAVTRNGVTVAALIRALREGRVVYAV